MKILVCNVRAPGNDLFISGEPCHVLGLISVTERIGQSVIDFSGILACPDTRVPEGGSVAGHNFGR